MTYSLSYVFLIFDQDSGLNGTIPIEIGIPKDVQNMILADNEFTGIIPTEIGNLQSLLIFLSLRKSLTRNFYYRSG